MPSSKDINAPSLPSLAGLSRSFDHAPWAVLASSGEAHIVRYANPEFCRLIDKAQDEVIGKPFDGLSPQSGECLALLDRVYRTGTAASFTAEEQAAPFPLFFSYTLWPVIAHGRTAGVMIKVNETGPLHETRHAISEALLLGALRQHDLVEAAASANLHLQTEVRDHKQLENDAKLLTREISHRVKNNLQVIVTLIRNEIRGTPAPCVQGLQAMEERIVAIAHLYDLMSQSSRGHAIALDAYLMEIARSLSASLVGGTSGIRIAVQAEPLEIDSDRAVALGLLVNELGTNAVKHAFPDDEGLVTIVVRRIGDEIELKVSDNGIGPAAQSQAVKPGKHGADYVAIFVRQLRGSIDRAGTADVGTTVCIRFPLFDG